MQSQHIYPVFVSKSKSCIILHPLINIHQILYTQNPADYADKAASTPAVKQLPGQMSVLVLIQALPVVDVQSPRWG